MDELSAHSAVNHRHLFEQWLREQYPDTPILTVSPVDDRYLSPDASLAWSAWNAAWNTRAASGGDAASLEPRARELLAAEYERNGWPTGATRIRTGGMDSPFEGCAIRAIIAALANQQGMGADALRYAAYFRWLMRGKNLELAAALMAKDQYATLRRLCESLVPLDDAPNQPAGDVGPTCNRNCDCVGPCKAGLEP